jgi:hypothetical protein
MKKIKGWFNSEASRIIKSLKSVREMILDQADTTMMMLEGPIELESFDGVYNLSDLDSRTKWRSSMDKEF